LITGFSGWCGDRHPKASMRAAGSQIAALDRKDGNAMPGTPSAHSSNEKQFFFELLTDLRDDHFPAC